MTRLPYKCHRIDRQVLEFRSADRFRSLQIDSYKSYHCLPRALLSFIRLVSRFRREDDISVHPTYRNGSSSSSISFSSALLAAWVHRSRTSSCNWLCSDELSQGMFFMSLSTALARMSESWDWDLGVMMESWGPAKWLRETQTRCSNSAIDGCNLRSSIDLRFSMAESGDCICERRIRSIFSNEVVGPSSSPNGQSPPHGYDSAVALSCPDCALCSVWGLGARCSAER